MNNLFINNLSPEVEHGNKEYKRYFKDLNKKKFYSLTAQMNWRLNEGDGICYYYIGVNDDGTIYNQLTKKEYNYSLKVLKNMVKECNSKISEIKCIDNYYIITIKKNWIIERLNEYRILLVGDTNTYKTTFLARLVKGKDNKKLVTSHKHEMESGDTSSMNYYTIQDKDNKYLLFDTPGNEKYHKTLMRMIENIDYHLVIIFSGKEWKYYENIKEYFNNINVRILNIHNIGFNVNKNDFINIIKSYIDYNNDNINKPVRFNVLQTFYNNEIGLLLSGFLRSGIINVGDILKWYNKDTYKIEIISIHGSNNFNNNNISLNKIISPCIATLCVKSNEIDMEININKKLKYGYII